MTSLAQLFATMASPWGWAILAVVLAGAELLAPGIYLVWLAAAAAGTAIFAALFGIAWEVQLTIFAALSLASIAFARTMLADGADHAETGLNRRGTALLGTRVTVVETLRAGRGRVQIADSTWTAHGPDLPAGADAVVIGVEGNVVIIEAATAPPRLAER